MQYKCVLSKQGESVYYGEERNFLRTMESLLLMEKDSMHRLQPFEHACIDYIKALRFEILLLRDKENRDA